MCLGCGRRHRQGDCRIYGHGLRFRVLLGPTESGGAPEKRRVPTRRFLCVACTCVMVVVPGEVGPYVHFSLTAIAFALATWGIEGRQAGDVRELVSPTAPVGFGDPRAWPRLRHWTRRRTVLWREVRVAARTTLRETAASLIGALTARMPRAPPRPTPAHAWLAALVC